MSLSDLDRTKSIKDREPELRIELENGFEEVYILDRWESADAGQFHASGPSIVTHQKVGGSIQTIEKYVSDGNFWRWVQSLIDGRRDALDALREKGFEDLAEEILDENAEAYRDDLDDVDKPSEQIGDLSKLEKLKLSAQDRIRKGLGVLEDILRNDGAGVHNEAELNESQKEELRQIESDLDEALWDLRDFLNEHLNE